MTCAMSGRSNCGEQQRHRQMCGAAWKDDEIFLAALWLRKMSDRRPVETAAKIAQK